MDTYGNVGNFREWNGILVIRMKVVELGCDFPLTVELDELIEC